MGTLRALGFLALGAILGCSEEVKDPRGRLSFGWVDGGCLAVAEDDVASGSRVGVIPLDSDSLTEASVVGQALPPGECSSRLAGRAGTSNLRDVRFYRLDRSPLAETSLAIALLDPPASFSPETPKSATDLDGDGRTDSFTVCTTSEGLRLEMWPGPEQSGAPLWSGYYALGYDLEPTCPVGSEDE